MKQLKTADEIGKHNNFLFSQVDEKTPKKSQISLVIWTEEIHPSMSGKQGAYTPPNFCFHYTPVELDGYMGRTIDIEVHFIVDEPKFFVIKNMKVTNPRPTIDSLFKKAISDAGGTMEQESSKVGYIKHAFANEKELKTYKVVNTGEFYEVSQLNGPKGATYWKPFNVRSPKTKAIIKLFKDALANDTLQTSL